MSGLNQKRNLPVDPTGFYAERSFQDGFHQ